MQYTAHTEQYTMHTLQCTEHTEQYTMHTLNCTEHTERCNAKHSAHTEQFTDPTAHYTNSIAKSKTLIPINSNILEHC